MPATLCYHCDERTLGEERCHLCGRMFDRSVAQRLGAARRTANRIEREPLLDEPLKLELIETIDAHVRKVSVAAIAADEERERIAKVATLEPEPEPPVAETTPEPVAATPAFPVAAPTPPPPSPAAKRTKRRSELWSRLGPAFAENLLFTLAAFLLVGGAVYFVTTAWTTMTGTTRLVVVFGGLQLFGGLLFAAGKALNRGGRLDEVERTLSVVTTLMVPIAALVAGRLLEASWPLGLLAVAVTGATGLAVAGATARQQHPGILRAFPRWLLGLSAVGVIAPWLAAIPLWSAVLTTVTLVAAGDAIARGIPHALPRKPTFWIVTIALLGFTALAVTAGIALDAEGAPIRRLSMAGVVLAAIGWAATRFDVARHSAIGQAATGHALASVWIGALALSFTGCAFASAEPRMLLLATATTTATAWTAGIRLGRVALWWPGLVASSITYFLLPAPIEEVAMQVRTWFAGSLGYTPEALPISFYGITFLPYTAALALFAAALRRRGHEKFASVTLAWTLAVAGILAVISITAGADARAPAAVLGAEGLLLLALGAWTRRQRLVFTGMLATYGGMTFALAHLDWPVTHAILVLATAGLCAFGVATWLQRRGPTDEFSSRASHAMIDASAILTVLLGAFAISPSVAWFSTSPAVDVLAYATLATLLAGVAAAYRVAWLGIGAWFVVGMSLLSSARWFGGEDAPAMAMLFAIASAAPLAFARFATWRPAIRREGLMPATQSVAVPTLFGVFALQLFLAPALFALGESWPATPVTVALALIVSAAVSALASLATQLRFASAVFPVQLAAAAFVSFAAAGVEPDGFAGALAFGTTALLTLGFRTAMRPIDEGFRALEVAGSVALGIGVVAATWIVLVRIEAGPEWLPRMDGLAFLLTAIATLGSGVLGILTATNAQRPLAAGLAAAAMPLVAIATCDALQLRAAWYPIALALTALGGRWIGGRPGASIAVLNLGLALAAAILVAAVDLTGDGVLIATFAAVALVGRVSLDAFPQFRSVAVLTGVGGALWFTAVNLPLGIDAGWLPAAALGYAAAAMFAHRLPWLGVEARGQRWVTLPIGIAGIALGALHAVATVLLSESPVVEHAERYAAGLGLAAWGIARASHVTGNARIQWSVACTALAVFALPFANLCLSDRSDLPDLEIALLAVATLAFRRPRAILFAYALVGLSIALTDFDVAHLSTPLALTVATAVPFVLHARGQRHVATAGTLTLLGAFAWALYAMPSPIPSEIEPFAILALVAAAVSVGWRISERMLVGPAARAVTTTTSGLALALAAGQTILAMGTVAAAGPAIAAITAASLVAAIHIGRAMRERTAWPVYVTVLAALTAYAFGVLRTSFFTALDGYHFHVVMLLGIGMLLAARGARPWLARPLAHAGLALPIPAIAVVGTTPSIDGALALLLAATTYGYAAFTYRRRILAWGAAALLNASIVSLWMHHGLLDPALYGVPIGLTLAIGSELVRRPREQIVLRAIGFVTLYGSIAVQVLRVEEPTHALVLFAAGLVAVAFGFWRRRNDFLLIGTAAVVVDVIAYLARHGLERDFIGAGLLVGAGAMVLVAAVTSRRRRQEQQA